MGQRAYPSQGYCEEKQKLKERNNRKLKLILTSNLSHQYIVYALVVWAAMALPKHSSKWLLYLLTNFPNLMVEEDAL